MVTIGPAGRIASCHVSSATHLSCAELCFQKNGISCPQLCPRRRDANKWQLYESQAKQTYKRELGL